MPKPRSALKSSCAESEVTSRKYAITDYPSLAQTMSHLLTMIPSCLQAGWRVSLTLSAYEVPPVSGLLDQPLSHQSIGATVTYSNTPDFSDFTNTRSLTMSGGQGTFRMQAPSSPSPTTPTKGTFSSSKRATWRSGRRHSSR